MTSFDPTRLSPAANPALTPAAITPRSAAGPSFEEAVAQADRKRGQLADAADQLVSTAFVLPLLSQVRDSPFKTEMFSGGRAEEAFGQQLDVILADRITASSNFGITQAMVRSFSPAHAQPEVDFRG